MTSAEARRILGEQLYDDVRAQGRDAGPLTAAQVSLCTALLDVDTDASAHGDPQAEVA